MESKVEKLHLITQPNAIFNLFTNNSTRDTLDGQGDTHIQMDQLGSHNRLRRARKVDSGHVPSSAISALDGNDGPAGAAGPL